MYVFLLIIHLLICIALIGVVLIQSGKGGGLAGGAFGGSAQTVFGGRGATDFITRATMILGGVFFITSLTLAFLSLGGGRAPRSLLQSEQRQSPAAPTAPGNAPRPTSAPSGTAPSSGTPQTPPANPQPPGKSGR